MNFSLDFLLILFSADPLNGLEQQLRNPSCKSTEFELFNYQTYHYGFSSTRREMKKSKFDH